MYCVKCGVRLADTENRCPLCQTRVYHPEILPPQTDPLYPKNEYPVSPKQTKALPIALTVLWVTAALVVLLCDLQLHRTVTWSGLVMGALLTGYVAMTLPLWFQKPNPVIFVPCGFAALGLYLLYINIVTGGGWFLSFALPVVGGLCLITCAVVTLLYYLRRGHLYILGGAGMALGALMLLVEYLLGLTFSLPFTGWSVYPLSVLMLFGGLLIYFGINRSAREMMERKLFF